MEIRDIIKKILREEVSEYARTLKNARKQGSGLRFPKSVIKANPNRFRPYNREQVDEADPEIGTGKKPKGSSRRLYTDENPKDTVSVKFRTKEDIVDTLNKESFKSKPHKRQSQIINLIHQRVRAAYQNAKDPETKKRLKRAYDYIETQKEKSKQKTIRLQKESVDEKITCKCGWSWKLKDGGNDPYTCHKCGHDNSKKELTEKCWKGYTQKGMKTMFGKRYPNCVKKTNIKEEILTKSTNKEFNKYKDSKFYSLSEYTFQDIVDNWDELSNHRNHNIKTIKFFVENPDEITELTYDEKGLEDGYHRLIASKILNKPRVKYTMLKEDSNKKQNAVQVYIDEYGLKKTIEEFGSLFSVAKKLNLTLKELFEKYNIIDEVIKELKRTCEEMNDEDNEYVTYSACDFIEVLTEVEIVDIRKDNTIELKLRYESIFNNLSEYSFIYELEHELKNYGDFKIDVIDSINTHNRQW